MQTLFQLKLFCVKRGNLSAIFVKSYTEGVLSPPSLAVTRLYCKTCPSQGGDKTAPYLGQVIRWTGLQDVCTAVV